MTADMQNDPANSRATAREPAFSWEQARPENDPIAKPQPAPSSPIMVAPKDEASLPSILGELSATPEGGVYRMLEKLRDIDVNSEADALTQAAPLINAKDQSHLVEGLIRALRTNEFKVFEYDAVRAAALNALLPYAAGNVSVQKVCVEELETRLKFPLARAAAIRTLNVIPSVSGDDLATRIFNLAFKPNDPDLTNLNPRLSGSVDSSALSRLRQFTRKAWLNNDSIAQSNFQALALSRDLGAISDLVRYAYIPSYRLPTRHEASEFRNFGWALLANCAMNIGAAALYTSAHDPSLVGLVASIVACAELAVFLVGTIGEQDKKITTIHTLMALPAVLAYKFWPGNRIKVDRGEIAIGSIKALGTIADHHRVQSKLISLISAKKVSLTVKEQAAEVLSKYQLEQHKFDGSQVGPAVDAVSNLSSKDPIVRKLLLHSLESTANEAAAAGAFKLLDDPDPVVRQQAYKTSDALLRRRGNSH